MTPALFDLPLRLGDAVALAGMLFDQPASVRLRPLTDEIRSRLAGRASAIKFGSMKPLMASLERDPVHPCAWYVCVDGVQNQPLLLRVAPAATPSSGLFPKAILIGRTFVGLQEVVLNVVPFGVEDHSHIQTFSEQVNKVFLPGTPGSRRSMRVSGEIPAESFPAAFEGFRKLLRATGQSAASFGPMEGQDPQSFYFATLWAAIRTGWREGYTLHAPAPLAALAGVRGRPFETGLDTAREIFLRAGLSKQEILDCFQA